MVFEGPGGCSGYTVLAIHTGSLSLLVVHALYHLWQWLAWPPPAALEALYGPSDVGRVIHAVTEAIVVLGLFLGLIRASGCR